MGPVYDVPAIFADEHMVARGSFVTVEDPQLGPMRLVNVVPRLSDTPGRVCHTGPQLGSIMRRSMGSWDSMTPSYKAWRRKPSFD
jgi:crotonobetainyl-CoA:carnitine CoA-transferase CaiB-like acyl-CoA transferase